MKIRLSLTFLGFLLLTRLLSAETQDVSSCRIVLAPGSKLWLDGDSTIHRYESEASVIQIDSQVPLNKAVAESGKTPSVDILIQSTTVTVFVLTIPVEKMKSGIVGLASQMHKALKHKAHPNIVFRMRNYQAHPTQDTEDAENLYTITVEGDLTLAGVTNRISVETLGAIEEDRLHATGQKNLLMSDFGVTPPTLFFGSIKVANEVNIHWDLNLTLTSERSDTMAPTPLP
ncbi:MAG: hypothetical protein A2498_10115 [Lentisphaerae bacterium RIFOXYC12_FULL_60_16]|nr:MAG: hypothetical protein A2498_10115 [Lentisphaerae bacterium RIFOXYC12_FULL_60_16]OGV74966.1 MAG: hypothetical protein A2269_06870 [Lentisphaerae bacterium RIFOXYA12_FULL_60_10]OGV84787.1 MAG: hypothetical protein A2340_04515 [Lentisphaerae bacterium RIFOXYB12_FULL_60_10]